MNGDVVIRGPLSPYLRETEVLSAEDHAALLDWTLANQARFKPAALARGVVDVGVRDALSLRDLGPLQAALATLLRQASERWAEALRVKRFELADIELELTAYNHGARFRLHTDTYAGVRSRRGDRVLSAVYYFHREPKAFRGGALRLHRFNAAEGDEGVDLEPWQNSLVVFPSWALHEVRPVECPSRAFADSRFAVNGWLYRAAPA